MSIIARPRYDENAACIFNGKIVLYPFTVIEVTKRASKNSVRGVMKVKPIESITKFIIQKCLFTKLFLSL